MASTFLHTETRRELLCDSPLNNGWPHSRSYSVIRLIRGFAHLSFAIVLNAIQPVKPRSQQVLEIRLIWLLHARRYNKHHEVDAAKRIASTEKAPAHANLATLVLIVRWL